MSSSPSSLPDPAEFLRTLRKSEERFRAFMDHSPAVAWMKDEAGRYVYLSRPYEERFGVTLADWLGKTDFDFWPGDIARQFRDNDCLALESGRLIETVEDARQLDGSVSRWWTFKFPFADASGLRFVGGMAVDVTERERVKAELLRANAELREALDKVRRLETLVTMCAWTKRLKLGDRWLTVEEYLRERLGVRVTHGISEDALSAMMREVERLPKEGDE